MKAWYAAINNQRHGPVTEEQLKEALHNGRMPPNTLVWTEGMAQWTPANQAPELTASPSAGQGSIPGMPQMFDASFLNESGFGSGSAFGRPAAVVASAGAGGGGSSEYAGFWRRFVAAIVDGFILAIGNAILGVVFGSLFAAQAAANPSASAMGLLGGMQIIYIVLNMLYFVLFEGSSLQATPGKMAIGILVTDLDGNRISYLRAAGRYLAKIPSGMIFLIGFLMAGFTAKKQALHDMIAGCLVVRK